MKEVVDFVNEANAEIGKFQFHVILSPEKLQTNTYAVSSLNWDSILYNDSAALNKVPDKRGVYAFAICYPNDVLPQHGYILYIGIAGRNSNRPLRDRYQDYLNAKKILKRTNIAKIIGTWSESEVLRFYFAPVEDAVSTENLQELEKQLNTALLPPFSEGDLDAETKRKRRAFR